MKGARVGRRPRGEWCAFVVRDLTETEKIGPAGKLGITKMYWAGPYSPDRFFEFQSCAYKFEFTHEANEAVLMFVVKNPEYMGKLRVEFEFVPETEFERKKRLKEARDRRAWVKKWLEGESTSSATTPKAPGASGPETGTPGSV